MSHKIPKLNSHVHSTGVPNYNLSHSSLSSCTKIPSHALLNLQLLSFCPCFPFSPFIFHTTGPISQIVNASKTGTIDYTLDTNVTPADETRQAFCQMICFSTQFCCFWEHFEHDVPPPKNVAVISCFPRKLTICWGNIVSGGPLPLSHGDIPGIFGSIGLPQNDRNLFIVSLSSALVQLSTSLWVWCTTMGNSQKI